MLLMFLFVSVFHLTISIIRLILKINITINNVINNSVKNKRLVIILQAINIIHKKENLQC